MEQVHNSSRSGAAPTTAMPTIHTLDRRHGGILYFGLINGGIIDPNNDFDKTTIEMILEDTNQRHNREAVNKNVTTLVANAYKHLCIATSNVAA